MNIMLVSQCSKQALPNTRRILDQFAQRKGSRTWLTPITQAGLETLHTLLRQRARRNTAVACHCIRNNRTELLWIVGNRRKFDRYGNVPTDTRAHSVLNDIREDEWKYTEAIALLAAIAGLFHDFGKANNLFQRKLVDEKAPTSEPIRHEWVSARLFQAFVNQRADNEWLHELTQLDDSHAKDWLSRTTGDGKNNASYLNPMQAIESPIAKAVCWLILTHHRLPFTSDGEADGGNVPKWPRKFKPDWNSPQFKKDEQHDFNNLWSFDYGLPVQSKAWRTRAASIAQRALKLMDVHQQLNTPVFPPFENTLCMHLARCALMLADHCYSGGDTTAKWQDPEYSALANTRLNTNSKPAARTPHQKLDEHCIGVAHYAFLFAKSLPRLRSLLPAIGDVRALRKNATGKFKWQNAAYQLSQKAAGHSAKNGGFFINMASTGTGKTIANARMAYALSQANDGCRFSILLGLRTLTLQTGDALRERTGLNKGDLGVLIGSSVIKELHENTSKNEKNPNTTGDESAASLVEETSYISYDGELSHSRFGQWLDQQKNHARRGQSPRQKLLRLISSPVLVSTIDYLMPATESQRGGQQIAPILRLLGCDIILDEPDDFGLNDQPALCRLVYWAGMLGSRVIVSSATLSPALVEALFTAYKEGRDLYNEATNLPEDAAISCGWVDEFNTDYILGNTSSEFVHAHQAFIDKRLKKLAATPSKRHAELLEIDPHATPEQSIAATVLSAVQTLHNHHHQTHPDTKQRVSIGLVRMANINPLVAVVKALTQMEVDDHTDIHLCVYHSRHPLLRRHLLERNLDTLLNRTNEHAIWQLSAIKHTLQDKTAPNQIFIVFATAVAEVGRDHCYDWAVVEPSSMRSIVQLAGRVMRHRSSPTPQHPNILILQKNIRALKGKTLSFYRPGYESKSHSLKDHDLSKCLPAAHYQYPSPTSCIQPPDNPQPASNLVDLEHVAMRANLLDNPGERWPASLWWNEPVRWCYQMQFNTRFRKSEKTQHYALVTEDRATLPEFNSYLNGEWKANESQFERVEHLQTTDRINWWLHWSDSDLVEVLSDDPEEDLTNVSRRQLSFDLMEYTSDYGTPAKWNYHPILGLYRVI